MPVGPRAQAAGAQGLGHAVEDVAGEKLRRGLLPRHRRHGIQIGVVQGRQHLMQHLQRAADIDDNVVGAEAGAKECHVDHECGPVQALRRAGLRPADCGQS